MRLDPDPRMACAPRRTVHASWLVTAFDSPSMRREPMAVPGRAPEGVASPADGLRPERRSVGSVERALDLLPAFSARHHRLQLRDLADVVGLPKASTHRLAA